MADWSQLPKDLLHLIAKRLESPFYLLRFRSVCSSWRSSFTPKPLLLPGHFPFLPNDVISDSTLGFHLSKRTILLLSPSSSSSSSSYPCAQTPPMSSSWLVKIEHHFTPNLPNKIRLLNPLSHIQFKPLPSNFQKVINLNHFTLIDLGHEYVLHYMNYRPFNSLADLGNLYMEKVVFMGLDRESCDFALLTIHVSGKLAMFKSGDKKWSIIHEMPSPYDDVVLFRREFYAVDGMGRTVRVGLDSCVSCVAEAVFGGDKKFLVESGSGLLLVDMYLSVSSIGDVGDDDEEEDYEAFDGYVGERTVRFKVFELDEGEKRWVELKSLGDRVLFLGDACTFSVSTEGLSGCKGNCVFFTDNFFCMSGEEGGVDGVFRGGDIGVFDLDNGSIAPLAEYPEYSKLFWPPPDWASSTASAVQNQFEELAL